MAKVWSKLYTRKDAVQACNFPTKDMLEEGLLCLISNSSTQEKPRLPSGNEVNVCMNKSLTRKTHIWSANSQWSVSWTLGVQTLTWPFALCHTGIWVSGMLSQSGATSLYSKLCQPVASPFPRVFFFILFFLEFGLSRYQTYHCVDVSILCFLNQRARFDLSFFGWFMRTP